MLVFWRLISLLSVQTQLAADAPPSRQVDCGTAICLESSRTREPGRRINRDNALNHQKEVALSTFAWLLGKTRLENSSAGVGQPDPDPDPGSVV